MKRVPWTAAGIGLLLVALVLPAAQPDKKAAEAQLRQLTERIERAARQVRNDGLEKDRLSRALRDAERSVSRAHGDLSALRAQRAERSNAREQLMAERARREAEKQQTEADLARQLRAAYFMGRSEPLKLLLNQRNPAEFGRNLTYYGYLGRLRATQINVIGDNITKIDELTARIDEEDAALADLELKQKERVGELESARRQRDRALVSLRQEARSREAALKRLRAERQQVEQLVKELSRATESNPYDPKSPFGQARGRLSWPVAGRVAVNYGATVAGGLRSEGIEIDADRGSDVRAVHEGLVIYSDYLPGRGYLVIVDHGNNYLSLYGHNQELFKSAGAKVAAGDKIATAGDSGGRKRPGLYFEIRRNKKTVDPRGWFRSSAPPAG
jgi:septal ring factor EnvC (AmiA/AmiB activator)